MEDSGNTSIPGGAPLIRRSLRDSKETGGGGRSSFGSASSAVVGAPGYVSIGAFDVFISHEGQDVTKAARRLVHAPSHSHLDAISGAVLTLVAWHFLSGVAWRNGKKTT